MTLIFNIGWGFEDWFDKWATKYYSEQNYYLWNMIYKTYKHNPKYEKHLRDFFSITRGYQKL